MALTHSSRLSFTRTIWHRLTTKSLLEGRHHEDMFLYVLLCSFMFFRFVWKDVVFRLGLGRLPGYHCVSYCTSLNERWRHGRKEPKPLPAIPRSHGHPMSSVQKTRPFLATKVSEAHCCATSAASSGKASKPKRTCYGTVWHGQTEKPSMPWKTAVLCTALYHFVPCCNACCNLPTV